MTNRFDKFCYEFIKFGVLVSVFTPLIIFRNSFSPFNFGKAIVFRVLVETLLIFYVYLVSKYRQIWPFMISRRLKEIKSRDGIFLILTLFTTSSLVSTAFGVNWHQSFWGYWERMGGFFGWLHFYAFFILAASVIKTRDDFKNLIWLSVVAALISSIFGFFQKFYASWILGADSRVRIFGTLGNPAAFSGYLLFNLYFSLFLFREFNKRKLRIFLAVAVAVFLAAIFMAGVRGTFLGLVLGLFVYLFLEWPNIKSRLNKKTISILLLTLFMFSYFAWSSGYVQNKLFSTHTIDQRFTVWKTALSGIKERPLLGWGPENFSVAFSKFYDPQIKDELIFDRAHNFILDIASTQGLVGLFIWLFLWVYLGRIFLKKNKLFLSLIIAHLVNLFFFFDLFSTYLMTIFLLIFVLAEAPVSEKMATTRVWPRYKLAFFVSVLIATIAPLIYWANIQPALANFYSTRGYALLLQKRDAKGLDYFEKAFKKANWSESDVYKKFAESYLDYVFTVKKPGARHRGLLDALIEQLEKEVGASGTDYSLYIYLHKSYRAEVLLFDQSLKYKSKDLLGQAINKFPAVLPLYYELFNYLVETGETKEAEAMMTVAYGLDKSLPQSVFRLGLISVLNGVSEKDNFKKAEGLKLLAASINNGFVLYDEINYLGRILEQNRLYDDLITIFEQLKNKRPEYNISLAYAYLLKKDRVRAFQHADLALELSYDQAGGKGFRLLSEIYKALGDNKKRSEALLRSAP